MVNKLMRSSMGGERRGNGEGEDERRMEETDIVYTKEACNEPEFDMMNVQKWKKKCV